MAVASGVSCTWRSSISSISCIAEEEEGDHGGASEVSEDEAIIFDMDSLRTNLPFKRKGLSKHYGGKSRSFAAMADARSVEDLRKEEVVVPEAKRKKYCYRRKAAGRPVPSWCRSLDAAAAGCGRFVGVGNM